MRNKLIAILSIVLVLMTTIAYSALAIGLSITGEAEFKLVEDIRVTKAIFKEKEGNASIVYENSISEDEVRSGFKLPDTTSSISYEVTITNNGDVDEAIYAIDITSNNSGLVAYIDGVEVSLFEPIIVPLKSSTTLTLKYKTTNPSNDTINAVAKFTFKKVYTVSFNTKGGSSIESQYKYEDIDLTLTDQIPTKDGSRFLGWTDDENGTVVKYNPSGIFTLDRNTILYAIYKKTDATLLAGSEFNAKIKALAGNNNATYETVDSNITSFQKYVGTPSASILSNAQKISTATSLVDVYAWYSDGVIYYYTEAENIYMNENSSNMFTNLSSITNISLNDIKTNKVTNMSNMFKGDSSIQNLSLSSFDMSNVINATDMLSNMTSLKTLTTPSAIKEGIAIALPKTMYSQNKTAYTTLTSATPTQTQLSLGYTITFNANGGTPATTEITLLEDEAIGTLPADPTRNNYTFLGWYTDISTGIQVTTSTVPNATVTYYARWRQDSSIICRRASTLHTETCNSISTSNYCQVSGHSVRETIYYGNFGTNDSTLTSGDAFDCDTNGNGTYDQRFYYVSDKYLSGNQTNGTATYDNNIAVLVYYSNTAAGAASDDSKYYALVADIQAVDPNATAADNYHGPVTAVKELPTTTQWSNIELTNTDRQIYTETGTTSTTGGSLPVFSYAGRAARLLTYAEVQSGCYDGTHAITSKGGLQYKCEYLLENINYANPSQAISGSWLETPYASGSTNVWSTSGNSINVLNSSGRPGVRPAIEISKDQLDKTVRSYLVKLNTNGGDTLNSAVTVSVGDQIGTLPTPTREGYTFVGWYTGIDTGIEVNSTYVPNSSMTLYAKWSQNTKTEPICKRVTNSANLHTETCTNSNEYGYCQNAGHALNSTITYGNAKANGSALESGDAFDCDTNGNGIYDERFYYISDKYVSGNGTDGTATFDTNTAVLVYYSNTIGGVASTDDVAYDSSGENNHGPVTAVNELPTTTQWSNISLTNTNRQIYSQTGTTSTQGGNLPVFSYAGRAARLLTYAEVYKGCYDESHSITYPGGLQYKCEYLMERTKFANSSYETEGPWFETPNSYSSAYRINSYYSWTSISSTDYHAGARPVIEVSKDNLELSAKYTLTFNANGGTPATTIKKVLQGDTIGTDLPENPTREGYTFLGWYTGVDTGIEVNSTYVPNSDTTYYAHWRQTTKAQPICKKVINASSLHTEACVVGSYCRVAGHEQNEVITYGNANPMGRELVTGDAFDCDLNGNGTYDERFYYVSDRYLSGNQTDGTATFDSNTAVLVYYSNTDNGVVSASNVAYDTSNENNHGPVSAVDDLPTTTQWSNVSLTSENRQIYSQTGTTSTQGGDLPIFSYAGKAARLLTYAELQSGCYDGTHALTNTNGVKYKCEFLFERTMFANISLPTYGSWLETPDGGNSNNGWYTVASNNSLYEYDVNTSNAIGIRPAIEVDKTNLLTNAKYTVTFNANGGSPSETEVEIYQGESLSTDLPANPTRSGYDFVGWYTGIDTGIEVNSTYVPNGNNIYYARWAKQLADLDVTISEDEYDYDGTSKKPTVTIKDGQTTLQEDVDYTLEYPTDTINAGNKIITITMSGNVNSTTNLAYSGTGTVTYTINKINPVMTIGTIATTIDRLQEVTYTEKSNIEGTFTNTSSDTNKFTLSPSSKVVTANEVNNVTMTGEGAGTGTLTVTFTPTDTTNYNTVSRDYSITVHAISSLIVDPNGGSVDITPSSGTSETITTSKTYAQRHDTTLSYTKPTRQNSVSNTTYTIAYNANGGSVSTTSANTTSVKTVTTTYTFTSWTQSSNFNGTLSSTNDSGTYTFPENDNLTDTITANYSSSSSTSQNNITLPTPAQRAGYRFNGWYTASSGGTKIGDAGDTLKPTSSTTYYAQWYRITACDLSYNNSITGIPCTSAQCAINYINALLNGTTPPTETQSCSDDTTYICKRVTNSSLLHTETCTNSSNTSYFCQKAGHALNSTITYGNAKANGSALESGDAFDCDTNGNGTYDQRFYYVSDKYVSGNQTDGTATFDPNTAVLVYYSNTTGGVASTDGVAYDSSGQNWHGPVTAVNELPTTTQWPNIELTNTNRQIYTQTGTTSISGAALPVFSYEGRAARLLTYAEVYKGCYDGTHSITLDGGIQYKCEYLIEKTKFANASYIQNSWFETPNLSYYSRFSFSVSGQDRALSSLSVDISTVSGARPAIEVPKSRLKY